MIFWLHLEKAVFKLKQNLKLQFNGFLFSGSSFQLFVLTYHHCLCLVLWTFYLFRLMCLVYLSKGLHAPFFYVWHYADCSWGNPFELLMALFGVFSGAGWLPVILYAVLLMQRVNTFFFDSAIYQPLHEQSNWYTPRWLLGRGFVFLYRMLYKFLSGVEIMACLPF